MTGEEKRECLEIRKKIFLTACGGGVTHLASAFSCVEILYTLYEKEILRVFPEQPGRDDRDRLILSKGHAALGWYVVLAKKGFFGQDRLRDFLKGDIGGEPKLGELPGVEASTGALGHGLSVGVGMALGQKLKHSEAKTYVILGDGESEEGSVWEAAMSASAFGLDNLICILDVNRLQKMTYVEEIIGKPDWKEKWSAFGWDVEEADGHDTDELYQKLRAAGQHKKPTVLICNTIKGKGVSVMENSERWHFKLPDKRKEWNVFLEELELTQEEIDNYVKSIY